MGELCRLFARSKLRTIEKKIEVIKKDPRVEQVLNDNKPPELDDKLTK